MNTETSKGELAAFDEWFRGEQGKPYIFGYEIALAAWQARAALAQPAQGEVWSLDKARRYVIRYNDDGEFGQVTGWLYSFADDFYADGTPAYVWRKLPVTVESVSPVTGMTPTQQRIHDLECQAETDKAVIEQLLASAPPSAPAIEAAAYMRAAQLVDGNWVRKAINPSFDETMAHVGLLKEIIDLIPQDGRTALEEYRKHVLLEIIAEWEKPFVVEPEKFIDRLRRMAEGEKSE